MNFALSNNKQMKSYLYVIAIILITVWILGFFVYDAGSVIHVLLIVAATLTLIKLINKEIV